MYFLLLILRCPCPTHLSCARITVGIDRASNISDRLSSIFSVLHGNYFSDPIEGVGTFTAIV